MGRIMHRRRWWIVAGLLAAASAAWGEEPAMVLGTASATAPATAAATGPATLPQGNLVAAQAALAEKIDAILPQLSADTFAVRDAAAKQLDELGLAALPILRERLDTLRDAEIKARVGNLIARLEEEAAIAPTLVSLDLKNAGIDDALDVLAKAVPFPLTRWPERGFGGRNNSTVTLHLENQPFWLVVQKLSVQVPIRPMSMGGNESGIRFQVGDAFPCRVIISGAFAVAATAVDRQYHTKLDTEPGAEETTKTFTISLSSFSDPRLYVLRQPARAVLTTALDDKGNNLIPQGPATGELTTNNYWGSSETNFTVPLRYPDAPGDMIKTLKGELHAIVQTRTAAVDFDDLKRKNLTKNLAGMEVVFNGMTTQNANGFAVQLKLRPGTMAKEAWASIYDSSRRSLTLRLLDAKGHTAAVAGGYGGGGNNQELSYMYNFYVPQTSGGNVKEDAPGPPAKLRLEVTTKEKDVTLPFEFKDLPIP